jgi:tetratricopeptide (TPR) repeat protein
MSNYEEARKTLVFALSSATKLVEEDRSKENLALLGMCHHVLGQYYLMLMDYQQALNCLKESLDISKEVYDESDDVQQVTVLMSDVSTSLDLLGRHDEATDMLEEAIGLLSSSQSPVDNEHMAILLMNLAAVTNNKGKTSEAVEVYMKADSYALKLSDKSLHNEIKRRLRLL